MRLDAGAVLEEGCRACNGQGATCTLTVTKETSTKAVFDAKPPPTTSTPTPAAGGASTHLCSPRVPAKAAASASARSRSFAAGGDLAVALMLARKGKKLALKRFARVKEGRRVLTLVLPKTLRRGLATLQIAADDAAGNRKGWRWTVRVPGLNTRHRTLARRTAPPFDPCNSASCATLVVKAGGKGTGKVTSEPSGIDCVVTASVSSGTCEYRFLWPSNGGDLRVALRLRPAPGSIGESVTGQYESATVVYNLIPGTTTLFNHTRFILRKFQVSVTKSGAGTVA